MLSLYIQMQLEKTIQYANKDNFYSSFPIWMPFISIFFLVWASNIIWHKMVNVGILVLFLILEEKLSVFHYRILLWLWVFIYGFYYVKAVLLFLFCWVSLSWKGSWILSNAFFLHQLRWPHDFFSPLLSWCSVSHWSIFLCWTILAFQDEIPQSHCAQFFNMLVNCLLVFCWGFLHQCS